MLNPEQIEIADFLLQHLLANGGMTTKDSYPPALEKRGFSKLVTATVISFLTDRELIAFIEPDKYWLKLLPPGYEAAKTGIAKYLGNEQNDKELERNEKMSSITSNQKSLRNSKIAIAIAIILPVLTTFLQIGFQYKYQVNNSGNNRYGNSDVRVSDSSASNLVVGQDSILVEKLKYSLKHDTVFLNEIKKLIKN